MAPECTVQVEDSQVILVGKGSDEKLSERTVHQTAGLGGEVLHWDGNTDLRLYITGKVIGHSKCCILKIFIIRPPTTMCNGQFQLFISQLGQTYYFRVCNGGEEDYIRKNVECKS